MENVSYRELFIGLGFVVAGILIISAGIAIGGTVGGAILLGTVAAA
jgi:hypothetical protein